MKIVLLSGGSGKRLWPMSNDSRSKQFLKVLFDSSGKRVSMLQRNWDILVSLGFGAQTYVCASRAQREMIEAQLGNVPFIEEPARRDTFPAIALSTLYLAGTVGCDDTEYVVVAPIDPMVDEEFFVFASRLPEILEESGTDLALMGVSPSEPSTKFGYIRVDSQEPHGAGWFLADSFVEKPNLHIAAELMSKGALWNCGVFCFRIGYIKQILRRQGYPLELGKLITEFSSLKKRSFDYEVVERTKLISVLPFTGKWKDLGTWASLTTEMQETFIGPGIAVECENSHVINELGVPVLTVGLHDTVVVATPDGILVSDKEQSGNIKEAVSDFTDRPMYEERRWGSYRVLDYQKLKDGTEVLTKCIELLSGHNISYHKHHLRSEVWTVIEGQGEVILEDRCFRIQPGDVIRVYPEQWHAIKALDALKFIEVQRGTELVEGDISRRFLAWEDAKMFINSKLL